MTTNEYERDFETPTLNQRFPGRFDPRLLGNVDDAGDGIPGLQKLIRNAHRDEIHKGLWHEYYVSTEAALTAALTAIGAGKGIITLIADITLTATKNISGGGGYKIKGYGDLTVIDCGGDRTAFNVTSANYCEFKDFKIDASDITTKTREIITINETSDNKVVVDNITIIGDAGYLGYGIGIDSDYCVVKNCETKSLTRGIDISGNYNIIEKTIINDISSPNAATDASSENVIVINITGTNNNINTCKIINCGSGNGGDYSSGSAGDSGYAYGIYLGGASNNILNTFINNITAGIGGDGAIGVKGGDGGEVTGIYIAAFDNQIISRNMISSVTAGAGGEQFGSDGDTIGGTGSGIYMDGCGNCMISENNINNIKGGASPITWLTGTAPAHPGYGYGIYMDGATRCMFSNNIIETIDEGDYSEGWHLGAFGINVTNTTECVFDGNIINGITGYSSLEGAIRSDGTSDYNIYDSNNWRDEGTTGIPESNDVVGDNVT